jgi:hypothetical protein
VKRVLYAAAAIGIAPMAGLMATAGNATNALATTTNNQANHFAKPKTVSLHGIGRPKTNGTCAGQTQTTTQQGQAFLTYWFTNAGCVGTVIGNLHSGGSPLPHVTGYRVRVWYGGNLQYSNTVGVRTNFTMDGNSSYSAPDVIRSYFPWPPEVCGAWMDGGKAFDIVCHTA